LPNVRFNPSSHVGLVPARRIGTVLPANRGDFPHAVARYRVLSEIGARRAARVSALGYVRHDA